MTSPHKRLALVAAVAGLHAAVAIIYYGALVLADRYRASIPLLHSMDRLLMYSDVPGYFNNASRAMSGRVPYRDDPIEYPVLALPFLYFPRLFTHQRNYFVASFSAEMMAINGVLVLVVARWVRRTAGDAAVRRHLAWYSAFFVTVCPWVAGRFDIVPAAFSFASACFWFSGRPAAGGMLAGLGTLVKIIPGAVALPGMIWEAHRLRETKARGTIAFFLSVAAGTAFWFALGGSHVLDSVRYHTERGLELGSLYSGLLRSVAAVTGDSVSVYYANVCENLRSPWSVSVARLAFPFQAVALGLVGWRAWKAKGADPMRWSAAAIVAFASTGKVLSPQYLVWIMPFIAALHGSAGRWARPLFLSACLASMLIYPWSYGALLALDPGIFLILNVRNGLLLGILGVLLFAPTDAEREVVPDAHP
jgi:hypothetical protein